MPVRTSPKYVPCLGHVGVFDIMEVNCRASLDMSFLFSAELNIQVFIYLPCQASKAELVPASHLPGPPLARHDSQGDRELRCDLPSLAHPEAIA